MSNQLFESPRYTNSKLRISDQWASLKISGPDSKRFLQGQTTNDVEAVHSFQAILNARVDRAGKSVALFYTGKLNEDYYLIADQRVLDDLKVDLDKFIIMDDVEISEGPGNVRFYTCPIPLNEAPKGLFFEANISGVPGIISIGLELDDKVFAPSDSLTEPVLNGLPSLGISWNKGELLTESFHYKETVDLQKGCFLGQEVLAKIINNRGPATYLAHVKWDVSDHEQLGDVFISGVRAGQVVSSLPGKKGLLVRFKRAFAVKNKEVELTINNKSHVVSPNFLPFFETKNRKEISEEIYERATVEFNKDEEGSLLWFERSLEVDPGNHDACESIGVCLGRLGRYQEGIDFMDKLLDMDPDSVMAHTNKSLYLMKLGKIEEAEEEKGLATVSGFKRLGEEARAKREAEELKKSEMEDLNRKKGMFEQVLEIDQDDLIANFGLGEFYYKTGNYSESMGYLEKVLEIDDRYSRAYLVLGNVFLAMSEKEKAKETFSKGVEVASSRGDLMPANEMQQKLVNL